MDSDPGPAGVIAANIHDLRQNTEVHNYEGTDTVRDAGDESVRNENAAVSDGHNNEHINDHQNDINIRKYMTTMMIIWKKIIFTETCKRLHPCKRHPYAIML